MKKFVAVFILLISFVFSACTADTSGYVHELTSAKWKANLEGGVELELEFDKNTALLKIDNSDKSVKIKGRYLASEKSFIIFMPEIAQNYTFDYLPMGEKLNVTYNGRTVTFDKAK